MPRKKETEKKELKTEVLPPCRATKSEILLFEEKAKQAGLSFSAFARQSMSDSVIIKPQNIIDVETVLKISDIGGKLKNIAPISNNLNQLVRKSHIHDETDLEKMRDILKELGEINWKEINTELEKVVMGLVNDS